MTPAVRFDAPLRDISITSDMFNYSIRPELEKKLGLFAKYGFKYIHWCDDWNSGVSYSNETMQRYRRLIEACGVKCIDVHGSTSPILNIEAEDDQVFSKYVELLRNRIEFCSAVGGDVVVIHPPNIEGNSMKAHLKLERSLRAFEGVRSLCGDLEISLAVENCNPSDAESIEYYFRRYPPEFVGFCFDSGHAHINNNFDRLLKFQDRLRALHLHDNRGKEDDHQPPFFGTIDWEKVMRWIEQTGYAKPINFEVVHKSKFFEDSMEKFLEYTLRSIRKAMALLSS
jgi:sugar phosphate isomerase/epimerase